MGPTTTSSVDIAYFVKSAEVVSPDDHALSTMDVCDMMSENGKCQGCAIGSFKPLHAIRGSTRSTLRLSLQIHAQNLDVDHVGAKGDMPMF